MPALPGPAFGGVALHPPEVAPKARTSRVRGRPRPHVRATRGGAGGEARPPPHAPQCMQHRNARARRTRQPRRRRGLGARASCPHVRATRGAGDEAPPPPPAPRHSRGSLTCGQDARAPRPRLRRGCASPGGRAEGADFPGARASRPHVRATRGAGGEARPPPHAPQCMQHRNARARRTRQPRRRRGPGPRASCPHVRGRRGAGREARPPRPAPRRPRRRNVRARRLAPRKRAAPCSPAFARVADARAGTPAIPAKRAAAPGRPAPNGRRRRTPVQGCCARAPHGVRYRSAARRTGAAHGITRGTPLRDNCPAVSSVCLRAGKERRRAKMYRPPPPPPPAAG